MAGPTSMTKVTESARDALGAIVYLRDLPAGDLDRLAARCRIRTVARGQTVFEEGAPAEGLVVILAGRLKLVRTSVRGREQVLHAEGPGATLGEVPLFDGGGYVASAVAVEDCRVLWVPGPALLELCRRPAVALGVIAVLARRVRTFAGLIEDLALRDVTARVAGFLVAEARRVGGDELALPGTRDEVAARLGTVRELVSRALSHLARRGLIEVAGRRVRVRDRRRLADYANRAR